MLKLFTRRIESMWVPSEAVFMKVTFILCLVVTFKTLPGGIEIGFYQRNKLLGFSPRRGTFLPYFIV